MTLWGGVTGTGWSATGVLVNGMGYVSTLKLGAAEVKCALSDLGPLLGHHLRHLWLYGNPSLTGNLNAMAACRQLESLVLQGCRQIEGDLQVPFQ